MREITARFRVLEAHYAKLKEEEKQFTSFLRDWEIRSRVIEGVFALWLECHYQLLTLLIHAAYYAYIVERLPDAQQMKLRGTDNCTCMESAVRF